MFEQKDCLKFSCLGTRSLLSVLSFAYFLNFKQTGKKKKKKKDKILVSRVKIRVADVEILCCDKNGLKGPEGKHFLF